VVLAKLFLQIWKVSSTEVVLCNPYPGRELPLPNADENFNVTVWALPRPTLVRVGIAHVRSSIYVAQPTSGSQFSAVPPLSHPLVVPFHLSACNRTLLELCGCLRHHFWVKPRSSSHCPTHLVLTGQCSFGRLKTIPSYACLQTSSAMPFLTDTHVIQCVPILDRCGVVSSSFAIERLAAGIILAVGTLHRVCW
jgi:hypothetical protein